MVLRTLPALILLAVLSACGSGINDKANVQAAIMDRLQTKTGLNMKELDVSTTSVSFDKNLAFATVAIHPKGDATVSHGMSMKYTLEDRDGKWVVLNAGGAKLGGRIPASPPGETLPKGHPSLNPDTVGPDAMMPNPHGSPDKALATPQQSSKGPAR